MVNRKQKRQKKAADRNKRIAKEKHRQKLPPKAPSRYTNRYATPQLLVDGGPLINARWSLPLLLEQRMRDSGLPIPAPVFGYLLLDTGASRTCISQQAAAELGLQSLRLQAAYGAGGLHQASVYRVRLTIGVTGPGIVTEVHWETEAQEVPRLEESIMPFGITVGGHSARLIGLLGRDLLRNAKVNYNGPGGFFEATFDLSAFKS